MSFFFNNKAVGGYLLRTAYICRNYLSNRGKASQGLETFQNKASPPPSPPVPNLNRTLERYLIGLKAIIPTTQYERTRHLVEKFREDPGPTLQAELIKFAENSDNWATHFWLDDLYLKNSHPLPIYSSGSYLLPKLNFHSTTDQLRFAARIILYNVEYKRMIDRKALPPDIMRSKNGKEIPLCMKTYYKFYSVYRRPGEQKDELIISKKQGPNDPWHIIVACKNQFYKLPIKASNSDEVPSEDILIEQLRKITHMSENEENIQPPVGLLTTENRHIWAKIRNKMVKSAVNLQSLQAIENCLFVLCIDKCSSNIQNYSITKKERTTSNLTTLAHLNYVFHGCGTDFGTANRWNDKFMQYVVTRDGVIGFAGEHSASDGITALYFVEGLLKSKWWPSETRQYSSPLHSSQSSFQMPTPLIWEIEDDISQSIQDAGKNINKLISDVDLVLIRFSKYGKDFMKSLKIRPDAYMQAVFQLTQYKVHRKLVTAYGCVSMRRFNNGRMDNARSVTQEVLEWVKAMCDEPQVTVETKLELFRAYVKKQMEIMNYTINGEGPDNHLLALREIANAKGYPEIPLFADESYKEFLNFRLCTSQIVLSSNEYQILSGYGPVILDEYGCCYYLHSDHMDISVSSFHGSKETNSDLFASGLKESLLLVGELCENISEFEELSHK